MEQVLQAFGEYLEVKMKEYLALYDKSGNGDVALDDFIEYVKDALKEFGEFC